MKKLITTICFACITISFQAQSTPENSLKIESKLTGSGSDLSSQQAEEALAYHNKVRADVGVAPLSWSPKLAEYAQKWANNLVANGKCNLEHRPNSGEWKGNYGENIAMLVAQKNGAVEGSVLWYGEISKFQNVTLDNTNWYAAGHYSQMVWRNTKLVGIGTAKCSNGYTIVVANYDPAGNYMGEKAY